MCALVTGVQTCALPILSALRALLIAIEWCGIIAFMKRTSPTNVLLLLIASSATPKIRAPARTATLSAMPLYIDHMKPSITIVITEPMINAAIRRLRLNIRCSDEYTNWYIRKNMMKVETAIMRSEEHTSELQSLMRISYAVFCLKKEK